MLLPKRSFFTVSGLLCVAALLGGCDQPSDTEQSVLHVWAHAGQEAERRVLQQQVARFNAQSGEAQVELTLIPERDYNAQVQAAALAGDLPDVLEFDGPYLYNYIWQQHLIPLEDLLPESVLEDLLPSVAAQGSYGGHQYSVGVFDSGLGIYGRKSVLEKIDARIPASAAEAWSLDEFNRILDEVVNGLLSGEPLSHFDDWHHYRIDGHGPVRPSSLYR